MKYNCIVLIVALMGAAGIQLVHGYQVAYGITATITAPSGSNIKPNSRPGKHVALHNAN
ncbi:MAG: hypothetical protein WAK17_11835 [Candidatus Nitrosopolaris sp.]